jgi:hypothetical protein
MVKLSVRMSPRIEYCWEEVAHGEDSFGAYMRCFSGCANLDDVVHYTKLLLQRLAPHCTHEDWMNYWGGGYSGIEAVDRKNNLRLTETEKQLLDVYAGSLRFSEYKLDVDRFSEHPEEWNLPFSPIGLRRKILDELAEIGPAYEDLTGIAISGIGPEFSSKFDKIIADFVDRGIIVSEA